jgi:hypothetical protein
VPGVLEAMGSRSACPAEIGGGEEQPVSMSKSEPAGRRTEVSR